MNSLSCEGRNRIQNERDKYVLKDQSGALHMSGNLLLKVIMTKSSVDNKSGAYAIRMQLAGLPELLAQLGYDITKFNENVKSMTASLSRKGETSHDLPFNLFKSYKTVPVDKFAVFINTLRDKAHDPDGIHGSEFTDVYIMDRAENKYKSMVNEKAWVLKENNEDKILALESQIKKLKAKRVAGRRIPKKERKPTKRSKKEAKHQVKKIDIHCKPSNVTKPVCDAKGKKFWWCSPETGGKCSGVLCCYKPSKCKGMAYLKGKKEENDDKSLKMKEATHSFDTDDSEVTE